MRGAQSIILNPYVFAALAAVIVGFAALWSNPRRRINQNFFSASLHVATWLWFLYMAVTDKENGLRWLRVTTAVGAFLPLQLWVMKESIVTGGEALGRVLWRSRWWFLATLALAILPFTDWFIPGRETHQAAEKQVYGWGYYAYTAGIVLVYAALCREAISQVRSQKGVSRLELQLVLLGGSSTVLAVLFLMVLRAVLGMPGLIKLQPLVILAFYTALVIAITTHRIFDARQIMKVGLQKVTLILLVATTAYVADLVVQLVLPEPFAFIATTALALWFAASLNGWLNRVFQFYPQDSAVRQAAYAVARRELRVESLEQAFLTVLKGWGHTDNGIVLSGGGTLPLRGCGVELPEECSVVRTLRQIRWATPERLAREKTTPERIELGKFLAEHQLGVVVIGEGPTLTVVIGVGVSASRQPFTYPQVTQLMELASIIENALERAHFSVKAQRAEQLATVGLLGASLAHEIRNPLVSIKAFVQLLPQHYHDPAFREKFFRLIGDEVMRIDRLTEQLLDLASPRVYLAETIELHPVLRSSLELVAAKAVDKRIPFLTDFQAAPDKVYTDASAAKQVLLNLCFNAIQAVESQSGERWVKIATRNVPAGIEVVLEDSGPGISPEIRPRLFQPFQSTKSSGFGLGLAICSDILAGLDATIAVDPTIPGRGATFRIVFPCQA
ncbi:MAG: integral rane sensor signal transduction histidine kinase [Verrucomicrobia bacterium]|nr:integral rane sensor signal transduction histidine kinase [Verrucomicrobiota bacterium]